MIALSIILPQRGDVITVTGKGNKARMVPVLAQVFSRGRTMHTVLRKVPSRRLPIGPDLLP
jgi:site-specific recombinase XerD